MTMTELSSALIVLESEILVSFLPEADECFGGAGVAIDLEPREWPDGENQYPEDIHVVTKHALVVSAVMERLRGMFYGAGLMDSLNKYEFFGRIGAKLKNLLHGNPDASATVLCMVAVLEAKAIKEEWAGK